MRTISIEEQLKIRDFSTPLALGSFLFGTLLFAGHFAFHENEAQYIVGAFYILTATLINGIMLLYLGYIFMRFPAERENTAVKIMLLLANIPIAILYAYLVISDVNQNSLF